MLFGPVLLSMFMARSFAGVDVRRPEVAVFDPGNSGLVRALTASDLIRVARVDSREQGVSRVRQGRVPACLSVPPTFDEELEQDRFPRLDLTVDETYRGQVALIREALRGALRQQAGQEIPADIR
ncbi:MAG: ABC transporter permease, partial [Candidatus Eremiobacterota bacterium]